MTGAVRAALVISGSVGAGHDGAAEELADRLRALGMEVDVRDYLDALPRPYRVLLRQGYTVAVGRVPSFFQWLFGAIEHAGPAQRAMLGLCRVGDRAVERWTRERRYAVVVSTYPLACQSLGNLRAQGRLAVPTVSYLTDPSAHRGWVHQAVDHHLTVTGQAARQGSADYGVPMQPSGPLVPARFREVGPDRVERLRSALGLAAGVPVALLSSGSLGLGDVAETAELVLAAGLVPVVLCGRNGALRRQLEAVPGAVALGWRGDVHELMHLADVLVHNAGGLTFTEAWVAGLPAVSYRCIPGHGGANAAALEAAGLAPWARTPAEFVAALHEQLARPRAHREHADPAALIESLVHPAPGAVHPGHPDLRLRRAGRRRVAARTGDLADV